MKLKTARVRDFRSVRDSGTFCIDDVTCLVGKNESGKTAILEALYKLNPIREEDAGFNSTDDYPRRDVSDYELAVQEGCQGAADVIEAVFEFSQDELSEIEAWFGSQPVCEREADPPTRLRATSTGRSGRR